MTDNDQPIHPATPAVDEAALEQALDRALARSLVPPGLPAGFHARLRAALARAAAEDPAAVRARLEREHRERGAALRSEFVRLRWSTLGSLIGGAFALGVGLALAMPWLRGMLGARLAEFTPVAAAALFVLAVVAFTGWKRLGWQLRIPWV